ncbi:hypothetical protein [Streptomyces triticisoli]|jgi:hypothetical protein|uniref:hypothetical protein n=1 Tax=Streptomyces triticisoli TaxID=2182797 RepID=UPI000DD9ADEE|nr:hypothetical protein [Streptomyces triticisoli]
MSNRVFTSIILFLLGLLQAGFYVNLWIEDGERAFPFIESAAMFVALAWLTLMFHLFRTGQLGQRRRSEGPPEPAAAPIVPDAPGDTHQESTDSTGGRRSSDPEQPPSPTDNA